MRADPITVNERSTYPTGTIIGKALGSITSGTDTIKMFVMAQ
jgi:hypothetical protein